ncbi:uncharacterized protein LOC134198219 [Corticium candelabrum]|uniref:uncharacterized protein LOC134198219 n=1 Tax=Corticium candelabrum TaxID=121492 RepID=UPI002E25C12B|nr:uncharacterized protein LOC134198219 [Corticium candelabrum]
MNLSSNLSWFLLGRSNASVCPEDCLKRGSCSHGTCLCEVQYSGASCQHVNLPYVISFGFVFHVISAVSFLQLILSIISDYQQSTKCRVKTAFRMTTSKCLYLFTGLATLSKGLYFSLMEHIPNQWSLNLESTYYPFVLASVALIVCFWAEIYMKGIQTGGSSFLLHSHVAYSSFCGVIYTLLGAKWIVTEFVDDAAKDHIHQTIECVWAGLMLIVFVFFLIFGVELFFKVRGAFATDTAHLNNHQVQCSRFGLVSQALFQLGVAALLIIDGSDSYLRDRSSVLARTVYDIVFRIMELAIALWFPCALWNWKRPEKLWLINPRQLLQQSEEGESDEHSFLVNSPGLTTSYASTETSVQASVSIGDECWICLDKDLLKGESLMIPANCKCHNPVHHCCLKKWILEKHASSSGSEKPCCAICHEPYVISVPTSSGWLLTGLTTRHWLTICGLVAALCGLFVSGQQTVDTNWPNVVKVFVLGLVIISSLLCIRILVQNVMNALRRARAAAMMIRGRLPSEEATL